MNPHNQAYLPRSQRGRPDQSFVDYALTNHGASANTTSPTAQRTEWYNQGYNTNDVVSTLPASYPWPASTSISFDSPQQNPKSPATSQASKSPKDTKWITESLSSSFTEHIRREGPAAHCCIVCNVSFQSNSELEDHAKAARHSAFSCACGTSFGRYSSLARHINSNTGSGYHCGLCEDRTLPRIDKLYDHLRDGHKVSQKVLDHHRNKALGRTKNSRRIKPAPTPVVTPQVTYVGGFDAAWSPSGQTNGMVGRHTMTMTPLSPNGVNPTHLTNYTNSFPPFQ